MDLQSVIERAFLEGYAASDIDIVTIFLCIGITAVLGVYIFILYRLTNKNSFYSRSFNVALIELAVITSAIILTIQSNIVVSLGMVGALSIVRFRTAIKDPMDLVFLFWSISVGIICGAGFAMIAVIASVVLTIVVLVLYGRERSPDALVLIVNADAYAEDAILSVVSENCRRYNVRARNVTSDSVHFAIEVKTRRHQNLISSLMSLEHVTAVSLLEHDGEVTV